ncbi:MAG: ATP-binding protein, partial [Planctomycetes bacterium]|nr:ATP-binding protein [Planctomycetota bacterium]
PPGCAMNAVGTLMFALMVYAFLAFVNGGFRRNRRHTLALVRQGRKLAETNAALLRREKEAHQLSLVAKNANDSVVLGDPDGRITWVNDAFTRITGFTADEAIGALPGDLLSGRRASPDMEQKIRTAIRNGEAVRGELQNVTKDGRSIWIETNQVPVLDAQGDVEMVVAIERDITAAKRHAKEMAEAKRAAEEGARAKAEFLATMSHEIRTPMNGVIGMADLICETRLSEEQRLYADTIRSSAMALLTIINDSLDLSKLDAEKMQLNPVAFDLEDCFKETIHLLCPQAQEKGIDLALDVDFALLRSARADDGRLRQILINLIGNAIKFTETGGVAVRASVRSEDGGFRLCVDVEDSGIGIPEDMMAHVFERFSQAEADTARRFGGTGLGLTISRLLVEKMGGRISVSSRQGVGSCFSFWIAIEPVTEVPASKESHMPIARANAWDMDGIRILVAEDNRVNRLLISRFLRDLPVELHFAHDGHQAVIMTEQHRPDLIFMDMSMPVIDGIEATRQIRSGDGHQPVIVALTANAFDSDREICLSVGMDAFLTKPVGRADLLEAISRHLPEVVKRSAG